MKNPLDYTEEELLEAIGQALTTDQYAYPPSPREIRNQALNWLAIKAPKFRSTICNNKELRNLYYNKSEEKKLVFDAVCELIVHAVAQVPAGCVAAYLVKKGLNKLCPELGEAGEE